MWFAALGRFDDDEWFQSFCVRLLEADGEVLRLLERDPFQGRRPRFIRAMLYRYRFSDGETGKRDGVWWTRELLREYSPILSLPGLKQGGPYQIRPAHAGPDKARPTLVMVLEDEAGYGTKVNFVWPVMALAQPSSESPCGRERALMRR